MYTSGRRETVAAKLYDMRPSIRYWLPVIGYCTIIFVQSSFPSPVELPSFAFSDKLLHVLGYGILGALICRATNSIGRWHHRWGALVFIGMVAATLYGATDEWHQSFVDGRSAEISDLIADFVGSLVGGSIYVFLIRMGRKSALT